MEDLTFRLDGIPAAKGSTIDFEGPLTLILQLLNRNRIEIKDVSISLILDQYMQWLEEMKAMDLEVATEFVTMASHLVYIKARSLLNEDEPVEEMEELVSSLELLKARSQWEQLKEITVSLKVMYENGSGQLEKPRSPLPDVPFRNEPEEPESLLRAIQAVLALEEDDARRLPQKPVRMPVKIAYSIDVATANVVRLLHRQGRITAKELFSMAKSRSEVVAVFLAVLELASNGRLTIVGYGEDVSFLEATALETEDRNESA